MRNVFSVVTLSSSPPSCHFLFRHQCLQPPLHTLLLPAPLHLAALSAKPGDLCASRPPGSPLLHSSPADRLRRSDS